MTAMTAFSRSTRRPRKPDAALAVRARHKARGRSLPPEPRPQAYIAADPLPGRPDPSESLADLLVRAAASDGWMVFVQGHGADRRMTYAELLQRAGARLAGLRAAGARAGMPVLQVFADPEEFIVTWWACILGGFVNVPLNHAAAPEPHGVGMQWLLKLWTRLGRPLLLCDLELARQLRPLCARGFDSARVVVPARHDQPGATPEYTPGRDDDLALIQYTSGGTSPPKGFELTHRNMINNFDGIVRRVRPMAGETMMSWMPLSHAMGLAFHLWPVCACMSQVAMPPALFARQPLLWLDKMSEYGSAFSASPNFGYRRVLDHLTPECVARLNLSGLRVAFHVDGAEPASVDTLREFTQALSPAGLADTAVCPVYSLGEAVVAVAFPPIGLPPVVRSVSRSRLATGGRIVPLPAGDPDAVRVADEGTPLPDCEVRVVDHRGHLLTEETVGHVQIRGTNVTSGYHRLQAATRSARDGDWLRTGDLGFVADGRLSITHRAKDHFIVNGRPIHCSDIEHCVGAMEGLVRHKVVACGWHDVALGRERVVLFARLKAPSASRGQQVRVLARAWARVSDTFGFSPDDMVAVKAWPRAAGQLPPRHQLRHVFLASGHDDLCCNADELRRALSRSADPIRGTVPANGATAAVPCPTGVGAEEHSSLESLRHSLRLLWSRVLRCDPAQIGSAQAFLEIGDEVGMGSIFQHDKTGKQRLPVQQDRRASAAYPVSPLLEKSLHRQ